MEGMTDYLEGQIDRLCLPGVWRSRMEQTGIELRECFFFIAFSIEDHRMSSSWSLDFPGEG